MNINDKQGKEMEKNTFPEPDYAFWDKIEIFPEWQVICLWCDMEPTAEASFCVKAQVIKEKLTRDRMIFLINSDVIRTDYVNAKSDYEIRYYREDLKNYALILGEEPNFLMRRERSQKLETNKLHDAHVTGHRASTPEDCRKKWEIPGRWEYFARKIGETWMKEQEIDTGKIPGVIAIAKYVEMQLKIQKKEGPFLSWETIKREALTGITGRKANGRNKILC